MNKSVYASPDQVSETKRHILTVLVDNEPGVLARVIGMFSGRGYNIDSLNVAEVSNDENISRITIVTHGTSEVVSQIEKQLLRIVPVHSVTNLDQEGNSVEAEVALVYIYISETNKKKVYQLCDLYRARKIEKFLSQPFFVAEIFTGMSGKYVKLEDTIAGFNMILSGELDDLPEHAFYLVGNIDEVKAKAAKIKSEK